MGPFKKSTKNFQKKFLNDKNQINSQPFKNQEKIEKDPTFYYNHFGEKFL